MIDSLSDKEGEAKMKTFLTGIVIACIGASILSGCNTVRGFGQDVSDTGHAISRTAS